MLGSSHPSLRRSWEQDSQEGKAKKDNAAQLPRIGFFNDGADIKGAEVCGSIKRGFVSRKSTEYIVARAVLGSAELGNYLSPNQVLIMWRSLRQL